MGVELVPLAELIPYARNARTHSKAQIEQIANSMKEFGWTIPILRDEHGGVIAGHGRLLAAELLQYAAAPCMTARGWSDAKKRAYVIADNKLALNAGWDIKLLGEELRSFDESTVFKIGFDEGEYLKVVNFGQSATDPNAAWNGMPEFHQPDQMPYRSLIVHFKDEAAITEFCRRIEQSVTPKTKSLWFPPVEKNDLVDKRYQSTE